jgi:hypothetical protein
MTMKSCADERIDKLRKIAGEIISYRAGLRLRNKKTK